MLSVLGGRLTGKGRKGVETLMTILGMPPPVVDTAYGSYTEHIGEICEKHVEQCRLGAIARLRQQLKAKPDELLDVTITFDGTWSKRGFTAQYGVCVVISWDTGEVLDTELLCKYCLKCAAYKGSKESPKYDEWYKNHKDSCTSNYEGSSPAMEVAGALKVFKRSLKYNLRYTTVISDGDSKTISKLNSEQVYGPNVEIVKHECVGHVQKRVGKRLRTMKRDKLPKPCHKSTSRLIEKSKKALLKKEKKANLQQAEAAQVLDPSQPGPSEPEPNSTPAPAPKRKGKGKGKGGKGKGKGKAKAPVQTTPEEEPSSSSSDSEDEPRNDVPKFKGVFTNAIIDKLQQYYGNAVRANVGDLDGMVRAC